MQPWWITVVARLACKTLVLRMLLFLSFIFHVLGLNVLALAELMERQSYVVWGKSREHLRNCREEGVRDQRVFIVFPDPQCSPESTSNQPSCWIAIFSAEKAPPCCSSCSWDESRPLQQPSNHSSLSKCLSLAQLVSRRSAKDWFVCVQREGQGRKGPKKKERRKVRVAEERHQGCTAPVRRADRQPHSLCVMDSSQQRIYSPLAFTNQSLPVFLSYLADLISSQCE